MIFFSKDAEESFDKLLYYPYTIGKHLQKTISDVNNIMSVLSSLPIVAPGVMTRRVIPNIGTITYLSTPTSYFIQYISWSTILTRFYYVKSNFITFNSQGNITSVHPALYADRNEPSFECDNGFKVVSRFVTVRGKRTEVFNFKDLSGHIICDIDFTQVKPFDEYKDMTARGYTPNRRCYMVFEDGYKEEVNESRNTRLESIINECVDRCLRKYLNENAKLPLYENINNFDAPLYHNTSMENLINMMSTNSMSSNKHRGYREGQTHNGICFTRNKKYNPYSDYNVKLTIDTRKLLAVSRGLKLIAYKDSQYQNVNEFEERLVSKSGDDFTLKNFNEYVTDITINLKPIEIKLMNGRGKSAFAYISELRHIFQYNLFKDRIKIIKNSNNNEAVSLQNAVSYLEGYNDGLDDDLFESKNSINYNSRNNQIPKFLYHATPSCYLSSIKKNGLGGKIPRKRFWDYDNTEYANIKKGCFLATDEYVAESYLEASEEFEYFSEWYEERYDKELNIVVFKIPTSNLDIRLLKIDTNQLIDDETEPTYFYDGVIPYNQMSIIQLY